MTDTSDGKATPDGEVPVHGSSTPEQLADLQRQGLLARGGSVGLRPELPEHTDVHSRALFPEAFRHVLDHHDDQLRLAGRLARHAAVQSPVTPASEQPWGLDPNTMEQMRENLMAHVAAEPMTTQLLESEPVPAIIAPANVYGTVFQVQLPDNKLGHLELPIVAWNSNGEALFIEGGTGNLVTAETVCGGLLGEQQDAISASVVVAGLKEANPAAKPGQPARTQGGIIVPG